MRTSQLNPLPRGWVSLTSARLFLRLRSSQHRRTAVSGERGERTRSPPAQRSSIRVRSVPPQTRLASAGVYLRRMLRAMAPRVLVTGATRSAHAQQRPEAACACAAPPAAPSSRRTAGIDSATSGWRVLIQCPPPTRVARRSRPAFSAGRHRAVAWAAQTPVGTDAPAMVTVSLTVKLQAPFGTRVYICGSSPGIGEYESSSRV